MATREMARVSRRRWLLTLGLLALGGGGLWLVWPGPPPVSQRRTLPLPDELAARCEEFAPRVEEAAPGVFIAIGHELANTIVIRTSAGNVVVDPGMDPVRAALTRDALLARSPGPVLALVYTHSHIDHVGGASAWTADDPQIWATDAFHEHFLKQYGAFRGAEARRGEHQFGRSVGVDLLPCTAIGPRPDFAGAGITGARMPTSSFSGLQTLRFGDTPIELHEAHGETHDQLFVWLPERSVLLPGDNYYAAFPNLYTIRGTSPRPVRSWIDSLDRMRRLAPEHLLPAHTLPLHGRAEIAAALTEYRDAIAWVRAEVVRGANAGLDVDTLAARIGLPPALAGRPALVERYGQIDWSVRAIYAAELGWFDERPEQLYPVPDADAREVALMGGSAAVLRQAEAALTAGDPRWALHLLAKLRGDPIAGEPAWRAAMTRALGTTGEQVHNTNGRAYLLEAAARMQGTPPPLAVTVDDGLLAGLPIDVFFAAMEARLIPERAAGAHASIEVEFSDSDARFVVTVRHGTAELVRGEPLPGTPPPVARVTTDTTTWKRLALQQDSAVWALLGDRLEVEGGLLALRSFLEMFQRGP